MAKKKRPPAEAANAEVPDWKAKLAQRAGHPVPTPQGREKPPEVSLPQKLESWCAGYRFVPIDEKVVPPPWPFADIHHARPHEKGVSGHIGVTWTAETPLLIGAQHEAGAAAPLCLPTANGERFVIPGATLKGMVRAVLEIATFSHLGRINAHHRFALRDFANEENEEKRQKTVPKAGWLYRENDHWYLAPCQGDWRRLPIVHLLPRLGVATDLVWLKMSFDERRKRLVARNLLGCQSFRLDDAWCPTTLKGQRQEPKPVKAAVPLTPGEAADDSRLFEGYVVVSNKGGSGYSADKADTYSDQHKRYEAVFGPPDFAAKVEVAPAVMRDFRFVHSKPGRDGWEAEGMWAEWLALKGWDKDDPSAWKKTPEPGIPVYYDDLDALAADPESPDRRGVPGIMGLSRVLRVPFGRGVADLAPHRQEAAPYAYPALKHLDFARALFGDVEGALDRDPRSGRLRQPPEGAAALKGRVSFGFAWSENAILENDGPHQTVMMGPRASFYPYYLTGGSYDATGARLAGRKRYPARGKAERLPTPPTANARTHVALSFLQRGAVFAGEILLHNLHPVELGAVLWALTFGDLDGGHHHACGRARAFGYGRLRPDIHLSVKPHRPQAVLAEGPDTLAGKPLADWAVQDYLRAFESYMDKALDTGNKATSWRATDTIRLLRAMANPEIGSREGSRLATIDAPKIFVDIKRTWSSGASAVHDHLLRYPMEASEP